MNPKRKIMLVNSIPKYNNNLNSTEKPTLTYIDITEFINLKKNIKSLKIYYNTKLNSTINYNKSEKNKPLISYIININISKSNTIISVVNKKGDLKGYYTAGTLGFKGSQKVKKYTIITILKNFLYNFNFINNKSVLINFKGITRDQNLFIKKLKEKVSIKAIHYNNLIPHNGCRPKKLRRK